ncbi:chain length determinant protein tyrosine kinase EpsG [Oxalobacteraceae bacterium OTU3CINTB1]|nr:chain length determinant protein tyrosine kinase EpsG [Oxalobacteraceae bacterium OTU3CINTB1]
MNPTPTVQAFAVPDLREKAAPPPDRSIGAILIKIGRLSAADAEKVIRHQVEYNLRFGDAALALGLLTEADIEFALSRQYDYPYLLRGESAISESVVAAYEPFTARVEAFRALRNQLMWRWFDAGAERKTLAIASAERGDGRSFFAANLAVVFSQQGQRTLLVDADLRNPSQHQLFGLENRAGLSSILSGRNGVEVVQRVAPLLDLSVLTAGAPPPNPSELLGRPAFGQVLRELAQQFDVILIDTPATGDCSDAQMIGGRAGGALVVARQNTSHVRDVHDAIATLAESRTHLVGTALNNF